MRWQDLKRSNRVEDRRGGPGGGGLRLPIGGGLGLIAVVAIALLTGVDPIQLLGNLGGGAGAPAVAPAGDDEARDFVSAILGSTEETWRSVFQASGEQYREPSLVLFSGATSTACGMGQAAMGPFYCPGDQTVYIDLSFYDDLARRFQAPGDFAQAYVIAHEVGHHVQNLLGTMSQVHELRARQDEAEANATSVRLELQADCYAGVWANRADQGRRLLESGDVEEALTAASAIGDDMLQRRSQGVVVPESFTHGTSAQRVRWFRRGLESGQPGSCDTFSPSSP